MGLEALFAASTALQNLAERRAKEEEAALRARQDRDATLYKLFLASLDKTKAEPSEGTMEMGQSIGLSPADIQAIQSAVHNPYIEELNSRKAELANRLMAELAKRKGDLGGALASSRGGGRNNADFLRAKNELVKEYQNMYGRGVGRDRDVTTNLNLQIRDLAQDFDVDPTPYYIPLTEESVTYDKLFMFNNPFKPHSSKRVIPGAKLINDTSGASSNVAQDAVNTNLKRVSQEDYNIFIGLPKEKQAQALLVLKKEGFDIDEFMGRLPQNIRNNLQ